jgi:hypothetical protein
MLGNELLLSGRDVPWVWYAVLWMVFLSPAMFTTMFAAANSSARRTRLDALCAVSLGAMLAVMEALWLVDARMGTVLITVSALCLAIVGVFRRFEGDVEQSSEAEEPDQPAVSSR